MVMAGHYMVTATRSRVFFPRRWTLHLQVHSPPVNISSSHSAYSARVHLFKVPPTILQEQPFSFAFYSSDLNRDPKKGNNSQLLCRCNLTCFSNNYMAYYNFGKCRILNFGKQKIMRTLLNQSVVEYIMVYLYLLLSELDI